MKTYVAKALELASEINRRSLEAGAPFFTMLRSSNGNLTGERLKCGGKGYYLTRTTKESGLLLSSTSVFADTDKEAVVYLKGYLDATAFLNNTKATQQ